MEPYIVSKTYKSHQLDFHVNEVDIEVPTEQFANILAQYGEPVGKYGEARLKVNDCIRLLNTRNTDYVPFKIWFIRVSLGIQKHDHDIMQKKHFIVILEYDTGFITQCCDEHLIKVLNDSNYRKSMGKENIHLPHILHYWDCKSRELAVEIIESVTEDSNIPISVQFQKINELFSLVVV